MTTWEAVLLGIVQGLTEFLPVSSSGHLVLSQHVLGIHAPGVTFEIFAHLGTLGAILLHYRRDVLSLAGSVLRFRRDENMRLFLLIAIASVPLAVFGTFFVEDLEGLFDQPAAAGVCLLITGTTLLLTRLLPRREGRVGVRSAVVIGAAQAFAVLPGISRSGSTIVAGLATGVSRGNAARFSFLIAIPALVGASGLEVVRGVPFDALGTYVVGAATAFVSGYLALRWLLHVVARGGLDRFGWYCLVLGLLTVLAL